MSPRRGRPPVTSRDQIVDAAVDLTREVGLDRFTMADLAARVGVSPMALYHHVDNRQALDRLVVERLAAALVLPDDPAAGDERAWLVEVAGRLRRALVAHPGVAEHLLAVGPTGEATGFLVRVTRVLAAAGVVEAGPAYGLLTTMVTSLALQQVAIARHEGPALTNDLDEMFSYSVDRVLDGLGV